MKKVLLNVNNLFNTKLERYTAKDIRRSCRFIFTPLQIELWLLDDVASECKMDENVSGRGYDLPHSYSKRMEVIHHQVQGNTLGVSDHKFSTRT